MLNAIAVQASSSRSGNVAQTMIIPAAKLRFGRIISDAHPRSQWRGLAWTGAVLPSGLDATLDYPWADREHQHATITTDPVGFHITDSEFLEYGSTGELPRNVTLRYQRALEFKDAVLVGKRAGSAGPHFPVWLDSLPGDTALARLTHAVVEFDRHVDALDIAWLNKMTPSQARCKGGGPVRNAASLPGVSTDAEPVAAPDAVLPPVPVVPVVPEALVKPEPVVHIPVEPVVLVTPVKIGEKMIRPNGQTYIARKIEGGEDNLSDVEMYRKAVAAKWNVLLTGVPGTGKTAALEVAAPGMITMLGTAETEPADFLGQYVQTAPGEYIWVDGALVVAMERGVPLLIDEVGLIDPRAMSVVYSVMDGRDEINVTMNPQRGIVRAKPGFTVLAATNPDAPGVRLSEALLSRFNLTVVVGTDYAAARTMGINERLVDAAEHFDTLRKTGELSWAPQFRELLAAKATEEKFGLVMAIRNLINQAPEIEREMITTKLRERFGDLTVGQRRHIKGLEVG